MNSLIDVGGCVATQEGANHYSSDRCAIRSDINFLVRKHYIGLPELIETKGIILDEAQLTYGYSEIMNNIVYFSSSQPRN